MCAQPSECNNVLFKNESTIRNQSAANNTAPEIIIQDIIIQIHKPKPRHEIRDPPDRRAPFRPRDRVARFRVQVQPHRRRRDLELTRPHGRGRRREVQVHVVGGYEEAEHHVGGRDQVAEGLEFDLEGGVGDGVDVRLWW